MGSMRMVDDNTAPKTVYINVYWIDKDPKPTLGGSYSTYADARINQGTGSLGILEITQDA